MIDWDKPNLLVPENDVSGEFETARSDTTDAKTGDKTFLYNCASNKEIYLNFKLDKNIPITRNFSEFDALLA